MILLKIAFRNALRYRRRSLAVGLGVFISIFALQFIEGFNEGFKKSFLKLLLDREGVVLISPEGGIDPFEQSLRSVADYGKIVSFTRQYKKDVSAEPEIRFPAMASKDSFSLDLFVKGYEIDAEALSELKKKIIDGREIRKKGEGMIGKEGARLLHIDREDTVVLLTQDRYGGIGVKEVRIEGIFDSRARVENEKTMFIDIRTAQEILSWSPDEVTRIKVNFREYNIAEDVALAIQKQFPNTLVEPYRKRIKNIDMLIKISDIKMRIFITIILIVAAGIIINTVLTSVFERKREIGTLRAIGAGRFEMVVMILGEVILVSLFASLIGSILAGILVNWLSFKGIHFGQMENIADFMPEVIFPEIVWNRWVGNILFILFWTLLAALYPVILAVRMKPCDALRR